MHKLFLSFLLIVSAGAEAQNIAATKMPVDEKTKLISYTKPKDVANASKTDLFNRALGWATTYYKNPTDVIREQSAEEGKIVCKARFKIMNPPDKKGFSTEGGVVQYTLTIQFKDARYKYDLTEINWKQQSYYPIERWMDTKNAYYKPEFDFYLQQVDSTAKEIISNLDKAMRANPVSDKKDDW